VSDDLQYKISLKDGVSAVLNKIKGGFGSLLGGIARFTGRAVGLLTSLPALLTGGAIGGFGVKSITDAMGVEEAESKFRAVFKSLSAEARAWSIDFAAAVGRSEFDVRAWMATIQDTLVPMGVARDEASKLSQTVVALATDLGSFNDIDTAEVMRDIQSATVGNHETMRKYGVVLTEANVKQQAVTMGLAASTKAVSEQAKVVARLALMQQMTTDAQGDAVRTADSMSNSQRSMMALFRAYRVEVGAQLAAGLNLGEMFRNIGDRLKDWTARIRESGAIKEWAARVRVAAQVVGNVFRWLRDRIVAIAQSEVVGKLVSGLRTAVGVVVSLVKGATSLGTVFGQMGWLVAAGLKLGFLKAINVLASGLQAVIGGLTEAILNIPSLLKAEFAVLTNLSFWAGLGQIIIGSLASVGAFLIKIFTAPLDLVQAGMDTIMKGLMNSLAGLGGDRDANGAGRVGRRLGLGVQENDWDKNLANARANSTMGRYAKEAAAQGASVLAAGMAQVAKATSPYIGTLVNVGKDIGKAVADEWGRSGDLFDTSKAQGDMADAVAAMTKYGEAVKLPDLGKAVKDLPKEAAAAAESAVGVAAGKSGGTMAEMAKRSSVDIAQRMSWLRNVRAGRTPDQEIADNTREMKKLLEKIAKSEGVS